MVHALQVVLKCRVSDAIDTAEVTGTNRQPKFSENLRQELEVYSELGTAHNALSPAGIPAIYSAGVQRLLLVAGRHVMMVPASKPWLPASFSACLYLS
jgi:hypothetical protein